MISAVVFLASSTAVLAVVLGVLVRGHQSERREWSAERGQLVNRAIARHSGEVIALDRNGDRAPREKEPPKLVEGLS